MQGHPVSAPARSTVTRRLGSASRRRLLTGRVADAPERTGHWIRVHRRAMACRFEVTLASEDGRHVPAALDALDEVDRLEAQLTVFRETSDLVAINRRAAVAPVEVEPELFALLSRCRDLHARTGGAFDIASTPLSRCWGFLRRSGRLPPPDEIANALATCGMSRVTLDTTRQTVRFERPGVELNLGSIGKGYALDRAANGLRAHGVRHALLSAGGSSVLAVGGRGLGWLVDIRSRQVQRDRIARLWLRGGAIGTSGAGEQYIEVDGRRYGHVLDPRTGWPASGVLSVTVATRDAATADALATAFLVGGVELASRYCHEHADTLALVTPDDEAQRTLVFGSFAGVSIEEPWRQS